MRSARTAGTTARLLAVGAIASITAGCGTAAARTAGYGRSATAATSAKPPSKAARRCANAHVGVPHPTVGTGAPPPALTSILSVLREPATTAVTLPSKFEPMGFSRIWQGSTRLLTTTGSTRWWLVAGTYTQKLAPACLQAQSPAQRRHTLALERQRRIGAVSVIASDQSTPFSPVVFTASQIRAGGGVVADPSAPGLGAAGLPRSTTAYGLVPDGVAKVTLSGPNGRAFIGEVSNNFVQLPVRYDWTRRRTKTAVVASETFTMRWAATAGATIKTTKLRVSFTRAISASATAR